jgi:hypothetical protein
MLQELTGRIQAVEIGHPNIHDHDVRVQLQSLLDRLAAVAGFTADFPAFMFFQKRAQTAAHDFMVVG